MHQNRFHHARRFLRLDRFVDHFSRGLLERDRDVALHEQVHRCQFAVRIVGINQKLLESLQLQIKIIETKRDAAVVLVGHDQAVPFRNVDLTNLETRLHEAARAQS